MHRAAADFFAEHGEPGKADRERSLADREIRSAEADRRAGQSQAPVVV